MKTTFQCKYPIYAIKRYVITGHFSSHMNGFGLGFQNLV